MKNILVILFCCTLFQCSSNDVTADSPEATVIGRWNLDGFQGNVMYEFTENKRYTLYSSDGIFESVQDLIDSGRVGNDWWYEGNQITVDLNFGNFSTLTPTFKCQNNVIVWTTVSDAFHGTYFREGYDFNTCSE
ncbi:hypothetical protein [Polaribacter sp. HL-MS24]|uniref:hypothetical protein n=1 Tax=Polaribacter sp. HL-MS24 TaxID=3077735 RepID=UPI0029352902|nr:hypothetical protein [Polaribacter sp. HL-MS24]WOC40343.1 hypothetical protein RRF69_00575 [Polaribacter sp. HL-MS24]